VHAILTWLPCAFLGGHWQRTGPSILQRSKQDEDQKMAHQKFSHIPVPSQAMLDAAMKNAREERAVAAG
jgi:hypothetical protein